MNSNKTTSKTKTNKAKTRAARSITGSIDWQQAMVAYADRCCEFSQTEEDTPEADAAEQAMGKAFDKVACIINCFFA